MLKHAAICEGPDKEPRLKLALLITLNKSGVPLILRSSANMTCSKLSTMLLSIQRNRNLC